MSTSSTPTQAPPKGPRPSHGRPARRPLVERRDQSRREARRRISARETTSLTAQQKAFDPLTRGNRTPGRRVLLMLLAVAGSLAAHVAVVGSGVGWHLLSPAPPAHDEVKIEVREKPPEPPPKKEAEPPPPPPVEKVRPKIVKALPPPEAPPPQEKPKAPPVRVVGLSLDSTAEGGDGPSFAVGNTRMGETDKKAVAPKDVKPPSTEAPAVAAPSGPAAVNQAASRIPVAGVKIGLPKRRNPKPPPYPAVLKTQGLEADVTVMVSIDASGKVATVKIIKEAPYPEFNEAARVAALAEEFEPATRDGVPMPYSLSFTYRFRLEDEQ